MTSRCPRCASKGFESGPVACAACGWEDPVLDSWVPSDWYPDPANPGTTRYYSASTKAWEGKPQTDLSKCKPIPDAPHSGRPRAHDSAQEPIVVLDGLRVLGGHGLNLQSGVAINLAFLPLAVEIGALPSAIDISSLPSAVDISSAPAPITVPYQKVLALEIGGRGTRGRGTRGRGTRLTGPRLTGGDFALPGYSGAMLIVSALSLIVDRAKFDTVLCIQTQSAEAFFHDGSETPELLRMRLSEVFSILRDHAPDRPDEPHKAVPDPVESLAKLGDMLDRGLVNRDEFDQLKRELLSG